MGIVWRASREFLALGRTCVSDFRWTSSCGVIAFGGPFVPTWQNRVHALLYYVMLVAHV